MKPLRPCLYIVKGKSLVKWYSPLEALSFVSNYSTTQHHPRCGTHSRAAFSCMISFTISHISHPLFIMHIHTSPAPSQASGTQIPSTHKGHLLPRTQHQSTTNRAYYSPLQGGKETGQKAEESTVASNLITVDHQTGWEDSGRHSGGCSGRRHLLATRAPHQRGNR